MTVPALKLWHCVFSLAKGTLQFVVYTCPPPLPFCSRTFELTLQLPKPYLLVGDFNVQHTLRGSNHISPRGKTVESIINQTDLVILNNSSPTHYDIHSGTTSKIDLCLCTPTLDHYSFITEDNLHNSDHYPIILKSSSTPTISTHAK
ncbi:UNVERIFIED_CONTAM: hypothetical protein GTU68_024684 [Idotea baltica]|nr:hypothetical protein [Idotea baltica]